MRKEITKDTFLTLLKDGMSLMVGGFMTVGTPHTLIDWVVESKVQNLTLICNDAGYEDKGVGKLITSGQVTTLLASHIGLNPYAGACMSQGTLTVHLIPQGTLAEQIRAHGAGLGGVLTPTGVDTVVEEHKQVLTLKGKRYLLEEALGADLALISAHHTDMLGNLTYDKTARNFNPVMASAAACVVAEVTQLKDHLDPEIIITPHVFIDHVLIEEAAHGR